MPHFIYYILKLYIVIYTYDNNSIFICERKFIIDMYFDGFTIMYKSERKKTKVPQNNPVC